MFFYHLSWNNYIFRSRDVRFGSYLRRWRRNVGRKNDVKNDVKTSKLSSCCHARESFYTPRVRRHVLAPVGFTEIPVGYARRHFLAYLTKFSAIFACSWYFRLTRQGVRRPRALHQDVKLTLWSHFDIILRQEPYRTFLARKCSYSCVNLREIKPKCSCRRTSMQEKVIYTGCSVRIEN